MAHALLRAASRLVSTLGLYLGILSLNKDSTRRRLPHEYPNDTALFVTWHLHGAVPASRFPPPGKMSAGQAFVWIDRYLDTTRDGPMYLRQAEIAGVVIDSLRKGVELGHYDLHAYVIMANHVHALIQPRKNPSRVMQSLKGATAREANRLLNRTGESFWQKESYDHWVRNEGEFERIRAYIENNPVKAGLVKLPEEYRWSSAGVETSLAGQSARRRGTLRACATTSVDLGLT